MKVLVINLDKDAGKLAFMEGQLRRLDVPYERESATYGKNLSAATYAASYSSFRWWCAVGRKIVPAEVGCALSHYGIYRRLQVGEVVCILEDDVILSPDFKARLVEIERFVSPDRPQVVMLSSHEKLRNGVGIVRDASAMCTDGYVITATAAKVLLKANMPMVVPCDHWWRWERKGLIELYHALPSVVRQDQEAFGTSTQAGAVLVRDWPVARRMMHKAKRLVGVSVDKVLG